MKINFLDSNIRTVFANKTRNEAIYNISNINWPDNDKTELTSIEIRDIKKALAFFIGESQNKAFKKSSPLKDQFKLASLFVDKKEMRKFLTYIYSTGDELIGSNGCALIKIKHSVESGFYTKEGIKTDTDLKYPDFKRVFEQNYYKKFSIESGVLTQESPKLAALRFTDKNGRVCAYDIKYINILKKIGITEIRIDDIGNLYFESSDTDKIKFCGIVCLIKV